MAGYNYMKIGHGKIVGNNFKKHFNIMDILFQLKNIF